MKSEFRTPILVKPTHVNLSHKSCLVLVGSCFTSHIGKQLKQNKFKLIINPYGISYHPLAIHQQLQYTNTKEISIEHDNGVYFSYDFHSKLNASTAEEYETSLQASIKKLTRFLKKADTLLITYGTAWVYELKEEKKIVANCHQQHPNKFIKKLLSVDEIVNSWEKTIEKLTAQYGNKRIIFTISPVRHIRDGFHENQLSKATLKLAVDAICQSNTAYTYFPSYEIMMDDLRDYRFYESDLLHPNQLAIDYIWTQFGNAYFSQNTQQLNRSIKQILQALNHKPFQPLSPKHQQFLKRLVQKMNALEKNNGINFKAEVKRINAQILPKT